jgi:nucleosome binding factor SPN SPT16 subunit
VTVDSVPAALFSLELSDTLIAFCDGIIVILAATKKAKLIQSMANSVDESFKYEIHVLTRDKMDKDSANFAKVIDFLKSSNKGSKIGSNIKEKSEGSFAAGWDAALKATGLVVSDISSGIGDVLAVKTSDQLKSIREGSSVAVQAFRKYVVEEILNLIDDKKEKDMVVLMAGVEDKIFQLAKDNHISESDMEVITPPILQSGGVYDLKYTAHTIAAPLHLPDKDRPAVYIIAISLRNKFCCCTVARTLFFNAKKEQQENYKLLTEVFDDCIAALQPGVRLSKIHETATRIIKARKPELLSHFIKELGWGMGYELRDRRLVFDEKNRQTAQVGMTFCLRLGLENLKLSVKDVKSQQYSILISDTVIVGESGAENTTSGLFKKFNKVSWNVSDEPVEEKKPVRKDQVSAQDVLDKLGRDKTRKVSESEEAERRKLFEEQNEKLARRRIEEQKRLISGKGDNDNAQSKAESQTTGYSSPGDFPSKATGTALYVDEDRQTVLVPVNGVLVPFHISVLKNVTKQETGNVSILRINFVNPSPSLSLGVDKTLMYIRELCFRSQESASLGMIHRQIMEMKRHFNQNETLLKAKADIVPQEALRINPNRGPQLQNVRIYPNLQARGKKTEGNLEAHVNGFRFALKKAPSADVKHVDLLYRNIKHAFFQPSNKSSTLILVHFRLINPIMVGKSSTKDLQFYVEYMDEGESLLENRKRNTWDRDEVEDESRHKTMVTQLDAQFKKFTEKVTDLLPAADPSEPDGDKIWDWDIPYHELEFQGNPKNSMVELYPTTSCIVHLATKPVHIIDLEKVDVAYYERIQSGNRNFDLAFVFKDFLLPDAKIQEGTTWVRINSIDIKYYDQVREVLQKSKLPQFEGSAPLKWNDVLKQYRKNFDDITQDGGWVCILGHGDDDEQART